MHRLPCPHCHASLSVATPQAGESRTCDACGQSVSIPKLGELRRLPLVDPEPNDAPSRSGSSTSIGQRIAFGLLGSIALVSLLVSGFCSVRAMSVDVPITTEGHIAELRARYHELTAAELIREYEDIERFGVDLAMPMMYRVAEQTKLRWKRNAIISGAIAAAAITAAAGLVLLSRRDRSIVGQDT